MGGINVKMTQSIIHDEVRKGRDSIKLNGKRKMDKYSLKAKP